MGVSRHNGFNRKPFLFILLVLCFIVAGLVNIDLVRRMMKSSFPDKPVDLVGPARSRGSVVWLEANLQKTPFCLGLTAQELFRQAVLIAARDEMGLQTRDASLREWRGLAPAQNAVSVQFADKDVKLSDVQDPPFVRWHHSYNQGNPQLPHDLQSLAQLTEQMSRDEFPVALKKAGWSGTRNVQRPDAPAPADCEDRLMDMEELTQFAVLRETYAAIRADGESLPRVGALVRAYANLAQLTRYHWSQEFAVYTARSLLYAQRMVVANPNSAIALYHRAYACALAGLQADAMESLQAADKFKMTNPPAWVALLEPFCDYHTAELVNLSTGDKSLTSLGMFLAFLTVEESGSQGAVMSVAQASLVVNPRCLRLIDAMCDQTGPGMLNQLTQTGPSVYSKTLRSRVEGLPGFPQPLIDKIESFKQSSANPLSNRELICQELISAGQPNRDTIEPSWAALGRMMQEITFVHIQRMANLISEQWGVDASDYVEGCQPFIGDHPFKFVIDTYGIRHTASMDVMKAHLKEPDAILLKSSLRELPLYYLDYSIESRGPSSAHDYWNQIVSNSDCSSFDGEKLLSLYAQASGNGPWILQDLDNLREISPQSPVLAAGDIRDRWDAAKAAAWEADHGDYPTVALALGEKYTGLQRWTDAERCLRKYIAVSPDAAGYRALADIFKKQKMYDKWLSTLNEYLSRGQDYGLQFAQVQVEIANYYMHKCDFKSALPYADMAAQTAAGWAMLCDVEARTGVGDFTGAEQIYVDEISHYSDNPIGYYSWCTSTGHGDIASAVQQSIDYYTNKRDALTAADLMNLGCLYLGQTDVHDALKTFQRRMKLLPGPVSALHIAIIDEELHDDAARDAALDQVQMLPERTTAPGRLAALLRATCKKGQSALPDTAAIESLVSEAEPISQLPILAITAQFFADRGHEAEALEYLKRCIDVDADTEERLWINESLRQRGIDPWPLLTAKRQREYLAELKSPAK